MVYKMKYRRFAAHQRENTVLSCNTHFKCAK